MIRREDAAVKELAEILKLLSEPNRLRILLNLGLACRPVTDIIEATGLTQTNVSFHLRALREAGLVRAEKRGPFVFYCLPDPELLNVLARLSDWVPARSAPEGAGVASKASRSKPQAAPPRRASTRRVRIAASPAR